MAVNTPPSGHQIRAVLEHETDLFFEIGIHLDDLEGLVDIEILLDRNVQARCQRCPGDFLIVARGDQLQLRVAESNAGL